MSLLPGDLYDMNRERWAAEDAGMPLTKWYVCDRCDFRADTFAGVDRHWKVEQAQCEARAKWLQAQPSKEAVSCE